LEFLELFKDIHDLCVSNMSITEHIKIVGQPITTYANSGEFLFKLVGSDITSNRFVDRQETESLVMTMQPFISMLNPMALVQDILLSYDKEPQEYINPELAAIVQQFMEIENNTKAMIQMGIPEEIAKAAAQQGFTPNNAMEFIKKLGSEAGEEVSGGRIGKPAGAV